MARFAVFYLFASAAGPLGKKDGATKSGRTHGFAPSLIMLRNHPAPHALRYIHGFARLGIITLTADSFLRRFGREHTLNKAEGCGGEGLTRGAVLARRRRRSLARNQ